LLAGKRAFNDEERKPPVKQDSVFESPRRHGGDFQFDSDVAEVFDDMITRSVPLYEEQQEIVKWLCQRLWQPESRIYDLGCATATTLIRLAQVLPDAPLIGYDNSLPMLERARAKLAAAELESRIHLQPGDLEDIAQLDLEGAGIVTVCWTLQFVRPLRRDQLLRHVYESLVSRGALIVCEKVLTNDSSLNPTFIDAYYDYKAAHGYSRLEISRKRESLENVLVPYRIEENIELLRRNGFQTVEPIFQWFNFAAFLCIKSPAAFNM
jgi:tRNA (cmo5U34)-methyltransferase